MLCLCCINSLWSYVACLACCNLCYFVLWWYCCTQGGFHEYTVRGMSELSKWTLSPSRTSPDVALHGWHSSIPAATECSSVTKLTHNHSLLTLRQGQRRISSRGFGEAGQYSFPIRFFPLGASATKSAANTLAMGLRWLLWINTSLFPASSFMISLWGWRGCPGASLTALYDL